MNDRAETCDTSILVPALLPWHEHHAPARAVAREVQSIPAHVLFETYSVLTRLPAPHRLAAPAAAELIARLPGTILTLPADRHAATLRALAGVGIRGGASYDGLIAATALAHGRRLVTLDRRALPTYEAIGATVRAL
jgi:predicted nucleic acid-binding protein